MANHLTIVGGRSEVPLSTIIVDGMEMTDVISYKMEGTYGRNTLTLIMEIRDEYELKFDYEEGRCSSVKAVHCGQGTPQEGWTQRLKRLLSCLRSSLSRLFPKWLCPRARPSECAPRSKTRDPDKSCQ